MKKTILIIIAIFISLTFSFIFASEYKTPHRFNPGDVISADVMNEIFDYIDSSRKLLAPSDLVGTWKCSKYRIDNIADSHGLYPPGYIASSNKLFITLDGLTLNIVEGGDGTFTWASPSRNAFAGIYIVQDAYGNDTGRYSDECAGNGIIDSVDGDFAVSSPNCLSDLSGWGPPTWNNQLDISRMSSSRIKIKMQNTTLLCDLQNVPPDKPLDLKASVNAKNVSLTWTDNSSNESGFKILRKDSLGGIWAEVGTTDANSTAFSDSLTSGTYWYRVRSYNTNGSSIGSNVAKIDVE